MIKTVISGILVLLYWLPCQSQQVIVQPVSVSPVLAEPGENITFVLKVINNTNSSIELEERLPLPPGWKRISKDAVFSLSAKQEEIRLLSFQVSGEAVPAEFRLEYVLEKAHQEEHVASFSMRVRVREILDIQVKPLDCPEYIINGNTALARFLITNKGNSLQQVELRGHNCAVEGERYLLLFPGAAQVVTTSVSPPSYLSNMTRHGFKLSAHALGENTFQKQAFQSIRAIPRVEKISAPVHSLPGWVSLSYIGREHPTDHFRSSWQGAVYVNGALDKEGQQQVEVGLRTPDQFDIAAFGQYEEYFAAYEGGNISLSVGDRTYSMTYLTEFSRYGRGVEAAARFNRFEVRSFYQRPRFFPELEDEAGAVFSYHTSPQTAIRLNSLRKTYTSESPAAYIFSASGEFMATERTQIQAEVAKGFKGNETGEGFYINVLAQLKKRLRINSVATYGTRYFPGYAGNNLSYSANINYSLSKKSELSFSVYRDNRNLMQDTIFATAPYSERWQIGMTHDITESSRFSCYLRKSELEDLLPGKKFHYSDQQVRLKYFQSKGKVDFGISGEGGSRTDYLSKRGGSVFFAGRASLESTYNWSNRNSIRGFLNVGSSPRVEDNFMFWIYGLHLHSVLWKSTWMNLFFQNNYFPEEYYRNRNLLELQLTHRYLQKHEIAFTGRYTILQKTTDAKDYAFLLTYKWYWSLPLEKRKKYGDVYGHISTPGNRKSDDIILLLNGRTAVTDEAGNFIFKNVTPGDYVLMLDQSSVRIDETSDIYLPKKIAVKDSLGVRIDFSLVKTGRLSGYIFIDRSEPPSMKIGHEDRPVQVILELKNGEETIRQLSGENGTIEFFSLRPGIWNVTVIPVHIPRDTYLERESFQIDLQPGESVQMPIRVRTKKKNIRIQKDFYLSG